MGKNSGGVTDWHKKQHKKQLAKNKEARIAARDERVVQEKTVQDVRAEIRKLEQQYKNEEQRPHPIQSKLDRLKKELKLVTAKEEADKQNRERTLQQQKAIPKQDSYVPLERPEVSVYFDAVMNPYGAPPPGQPKLYYRRGGGTTMNLNEACAPQEQFLPTPPPPPPPPQSVPRVNPPIPQQQPPTRGPPTQNSHQSRNIPRKEDGRLGVKSKTDDVLSTTNTTNPGKVIVDPSQLPSLPAPSTAVARLKQSRLTVDIWASQEELDYEQQVSATSLEGIGALSTVPSVWYYKDISGALQGPFTTEQMCQWNQAGYFPKITPVSGSSPLGPWKPLGEIQLLNEAGKTGPLDSSSASKLTSSVQERIASLRQSKVSSEQSVGISPAAIPAWEGDASPIVEEEDSVQRRIVALKAQQLSRDVAEEEHHDQDVDTGDRPFHADLTPWDVNENQEKEMYSTVPEEIDDKDGDYGPSLSVADRIAALRAQHLKTVTEDEVGEPSFNRTCGKGVKSLPLPPPPPPPPPTADKSSEEIPLYPVDDIVAAYPIDSDGEMDILEGNEFDDQRVSYLLVDHEYPVTGGYSDENDEYPIGPSESYPVTDRYADDSKEMLQSPKKKVKVDQAVRALVPSRLMKR